MNENILLALVEPGNYTLWLYDAIGEKDPDIALNCSPLSLVLDIRPTDQEEDSLNCIGV